MNKKRVIAMVLLSEQMYYEGKIDCNVCAYLHNLFSLEYNYAVG